MSRRLSVAVFLLLCFMTEARAEPWQVRPVPAAGGNRASGQDGKRLVEQRQHRRPDRAGQRVESVHGVQAADIADGALAITGSLLDGVAQAPELVGFAELPAPVTFLLIGLVRAHRSPDQGSTPLGLARAQYASFQSRARRTRDCQMAFCTKCGRSNEQQVRFCRAAEPPRGV